MKPRALDNDALRRELEGWIGSRGEALVDVYYHHSGGAGILYWLNAAGQVEAILSQAQADGQKYGDGLATVTAFRGGCYPLRGTAGEEFVERIRSAWPCGRWYSIADLETVYPEQLDTCGGGDTREELEDDLANLVAQKRGRLIGFGEHPFDHEDWMERNQAEVMETTVGTLKAFTHG
jgi:hypothetical protein